MMCADQDALARGVASLVAVGINVQRPAALSRLRAAAEE